MKKLFLLFAATAALASCSKNDDNGSPIDLKKDGDAITKLITISYRDALAASNPDGVAAAFTSDGVVMGHATPTASGAAGLKSAYQGIFSAVGLNLAFKIDEIIVGSNYGFVRSTSAGTVKVLATGATTPEENRELFVVRKVADDWKIERYLYNKMGVLTQAAGAGISENTPASYSEADKTGIITLITTTYSNALKASDAEAVTAQFASDGVLMAPDAPTMKGEAAIKATYQSVFSGIKLDLAFSLDDVVIDGAYGYVRSHSTGTIHINASGQTVPASYRELFVVKKVDGKWKIAWYGYNQPA